MVKVKFRYADAMSGWKWRTQQCIVESVGECIKLYGLGKDCDYEIEAVEELDKGENDELYL